MIHMVISFNSKAILQHELYYYPPFIDEETEAQKMDVVCTKATWFKGERARIQRLTLCSALTH
jgi:hypothetical protein